MSRVIKSCFTASRMELRELDECAAVLSTRQRATEEIRSPEDIMEQASKTAMNLVEQAKAKAAQIEEEARARGFEEGFQMGTIEAKTKYSELLRYLAHMCDVVKSETDRLIAGAEVEILRLSVCIAERIIRTAVEMNPGTTLEIVRETLKRTQGARSVVIRVNSRDLALILSRREELAGLVEDAKNLRVAEDPRVEPGGCLVEMDTGLLDARIGEQLGEIERVLIGEAGHGS